MDESEFKKLASNSRDWLIYKLLSEKSKESVLEDLVGEKENSILSDLGLNPRTSYEDRDREVDSKPAEPKGETIVQETCVLRGVRIVLETEKAFIVNLIGTKFTAVVAKSHLAEQYSKDDVRTDLIFKNDRKWALKKLKWEEKT